MDVCPWRPGREVSGFPERAQRILAAKSAVESNGLTDAGGEVVRARARSRHEKAVHDAVVHGATLGSRPQIRWSVEETRPTTHPGDAPFSGVHHIETLSI